MSSKTAAGLFVGVAPGLPALHQPHERPTAYARSVCDHRAEPFGVPVWAYAAALFPIGLKVCIKNPPQNFKKRSLNDQITSCGGISALLHHLLLPAPEQPSTLLAWLLDRNTHGKVRTTRQPHQLASSPANPWQGNQ